jgi:hypothetical protein
MRTVSKSAVPGVAFLVGAAIVDSADPRHHPPSVEGNTEPGFTGSLTLQSAPAVVVAAKPEAPLTPRPVAPPENAPQPEKASAPNVPAQASASPPSQAAQPQSSAPVAATTPAAALPVAPTPRPWRLARIITREWFGTAADFGDHRRCPKRHSERTVLVIGRRWLTTLSPHAT